MVKRIQNKIAESRWALPICTAYTLSVCLISGLFAEGIWLQLVLTGIATLVMVHLNNDNALIRIYSRMVSCSFLVLMMVTPHKIESTTGCIVTFCFVAFYFAICHTYQDKQATGWVFVAFTAIGAASAIWPQILFFVPLLWVVMATNILSLSFKTFVASVIGTVFPYWFLAAFYLYHGDITPIIAHLRQLSVFSKPFSFEICQTEDLVALCFITLLTITGSIHFIRTSYKDKIRTRMIYEMFIVLSVGTLIFILIQPQHLDMAMRMLIVSAAPLTGHFIALTQTKITNIATLAIILAALAITTFNLWI